jgi:hypothetical protein
VRHDRPQHAAGGIIANPRETDCGTDGTYAQRSTVASRSSPAAAQRCAEGAGLDGGDPGRSTITCAVHRSRFHRRQGEDRHFHYITNLHQLDGRDQAETSEKQARSIRYQMTIAKLPLAKDTDGFVLQDTPINESLVRDLAGGVFIAQQRNVVLLGPTESAS